MRFSFGSESACSARAASRAACNPASAALMSGRPRSSSEGRLTGMVPGSARSASLKSGGAHSVGDFPARRASRRRAWSLCRERSGIRASSLASWASISTRPDRDSPPRASALRASSTSFLSSSITCSAASICAFRPAIRTASRATFAESDRAAASASQPAASARASASAARLRPTPNRSGS